MMDDNRTKATLQKLGIPTAAGIVGTGVGLILTRKPNSNAKGVGNLVDDLRGKLESVIGKNDGGGGGRQSASGSTQNISPKELADRRRQREQRRNQRRSRSKR